MKILIANEENYFAQKLSIRLEDEKYSCDIVSDLDDCSGFYDIILLSTDGSSSESIKFIKKNNHTLIILLAPFMTNETVTSQLEVGATDYVIKPFSVDEIIRKIKHYEDFRLLREQNILLREQNEFLFRKVKSSNIKYEFPLILNGENTIAADKIAFDISKKENKELETILLTSNKEFIYDKTKYTKKLLYFCGLNNLDDNNTEKFFELMKDKDVIIYQDNCLEHEGFKSIKIKDITHSCSSYSENKIL